MEAQVSLTGWVGTDVEFRPADDNVVAWANFRLGSTPRFQRNGEWHEAPTTWVTVKAFRALAENVALSLRKGSPVVVVGRLRTDVWDDQKTGERHERMVLEAASIGHDLALGTSRFARNERPRLEQEEQSAAESVESEESEEDPAGVRELAVA